MNPISFVTIVVAVLLSGVFGKPQKPNLEDIGKIQNGETYALECLLSSGLSIDSVKSLQTGDFSGSGAKVKCLVRCFFEKTGFMDAEGNLQQDAIVKQLSQFLSKAEVENLVKKCDVSGTDPCDTAYRATECYFKNKADLF
ncbi:general odorant-binding protein 56d-like [Wyeomyia smithii]|uniref:general odorant-binding protein 56d-like n=1 Tax=Wyeomyia smithii TaxID=174621 RepID=UPI002467B274|nr:general odorant-binding protein 56d-like [Wyeomyia smithii]